MSNKKRIHHSLYRYLLYSIASFVFTQSISQADPVRLQFMAENRPLTVSNDGPDSMNKSLLIDMNGDSIDDLITYSNAIELFLGNSNGGFDQGVTISYKERDNEYTGIQSRIPVNLLIRDWNNDSKLDIAVTYRYDKSIVFLLQESDTHFSEVERTFEESIGNSSHIAIADLNRDGFEDIAIARVTDLGILWGKDNLEFDEEFHQDIFTPYQTDDSNIVMRGVVIKDYDGDGNGDICIRTNTDNSLVLTDLTNGVITFPPALSFVPDDDNSGPEPPPEYHIIQKILLSSDMNGDGYQDTIVLYETKMTGTVFVRIVYGTESEDESIVHDIFSEKADAVGMDIKDYNSDGLEDISLIIKNPNQFIILYNQGPIDALPDEPLTLNVPEDIPTLPQALRDARPGDTISLAPGQYVEPLIIENASLTIEGRKNGERSVIHYFYWPPCNISPDLASLMVENSNIVLNNFDIIGVHNSAFIASDSNVVLHNCRLTGVNRQLSRNYIVSNAYPAFRWIGADKKTCLIENSELIGGRGVDSIRGAAVQILNCTSSSMRIVQSTISGKDGYRVDETYPKPYPGSHAVYALESTHLNIELIDSRLKGGNGGHSGGYRYAGPGVYFGMSGPQLGGSGLYADRSIIYVKGGEIIAGDSGNGGEHEIYHAPASEPDGIAVYDGANGGNGLDALNQSFVYLNSTSLQGGAGGEPNGVSGLPYNAGDTSIVEFADITAIHNWQLF